MTGTPLRLSKVTPRARRCRSISKCKDLWHIPGRGSSPGWTHLSILLEIPAQLQPEQLRNYPGDLQLEQEKEFHCCTCRFLASVLRPQKTFLGGSETARSGPMSLGRLPKMGFLNPAHPSPHPLQQEWKLEERVRTHFENLILFLLLLSFAPVLASWIIHTLDRFLSILCQTNNRNVQIFQCPNVQPFLN